MKKARVLIAALAAALLLTLTGTSAQAAVTGGDLANLSASRSDVYVSNGTLNATLSPNSNTVNMSGWHDKVQGFIAWSGYRCRSQYSPAGSYPYLGNHWYYYTQNNMYLYLTCIYFG